MHNIIYSSNSSQKFYYVYRISNLIEHKHYYGFRSTKFLPKNDLGIRYFSSSRDKEFIKDQKQNPQNYRYKIVKLFQNYKDALNFEILLHEKFNVSTNESFYNRAKQTATGFSTAGSTISEEHKRKISEAGLKRIYEPTSDETKKKQSESAKNRGPVSEITRQKLSAIHKGREFTKGRCENISKAKKGKSQGPMPDEVKKKISEAHKGKIFSDEHKKNIIAAAQLRPQRSLEHKKNLSISIKEAYIKKTQNGEILKGKDSPNYGRFWVTNGLENKLLKSGEQTPVGFRKGRTIKMTK